MTQNNDKISSIKQRILQYIDYKRITKQDFCKNTGISYSNLRSKSLESEFGGTQITLILSYYDEISSDWLILGKGEMLRTQRDEQAMSDESAEKIELLRSTIHDKEEIIEGLRENQRLLREKIELLEVRLAHCEAMDDAAAAS